MTAFDKAVEQAAISEPFRVPAHILLDGSAYNRANQLAVELEDLRRRLEAGVHGDDDDVTAPSPAERVRELAAEMRNLYDAHPPVVYVFEQLSDDEWSDLAAEHGDKGRDFWPHAMAASCIKPEGASVDGFLKLRAKLSHGQFETLRGACDSANRDLFDLTPTKAASAALRLLRPNSEQPEPGESPDPDS